MDLGGPKLRLKFAIAPNAKQRIFRDELLLLTYHSPTTIGSHCFQASCTLPEVLEQLRIGATVWIDDGKIGACVESITTEGIWLRITHARLKGEKLLPDKSINFPYTDLKLTSITEKDKQDLDFIANHADKIDIIGYSFVQTAADIELLQTELQARLPKNQPIPAIVAKIETPLAVTNLPEHDINILKQSFQKVSLPWSNLKFDCTWILSKEYFPNLESYSLEYLSKYLQPRDNQQYFLPTWHIVLVMMPYLHIIFIEESC